MGTQVSQMGSTGGRVSPRGGGSTGGDSPFPPLPKKLPPTVLTQNADFVIFIQFKTVC